MKPLNFLGVKILCLMLLFSLLMQLSNQQQQILDLEMYVGRSYHILYGNPKPKTGVDPGIYKPIFNYSSSKNKKTQDGKYYVPDQVIAYKLSTCSFTPKVSIYRGTKSYQEDLKKITQISSGQNALNQKIFTMSDEMQNTQDLISKQTMALTHTSIECPFYDITLDQFATPSLNYDFQQAVLNAFNQSDWVNFITNFGTHYITESTMGARTVQQITYTFENQAILQSVDVDLKVAALGSFPEFFGDSSFNWTKTLFYRNKFSSNISKFQTGASIPKNGIVSDWQTQVGNNLKPINLKLAPLSDLFSKIKDPQFNKSLAVTQLQSAISNQCIRLKCQNMRVDYFKPGPASLTFKISQTQGQSRAGDKYNDYLSSTTMELRKITTRASEFLYNIKFYFSDGFQGYNSPKFGVGSDGDNVFTIPDGEYISRIKVRSGSFIDSLQFITNSGTMSSHIGGDGGTQKIIDVPQDYKIVGMSGVYSSIAVLKMEFYFAKLVYPAYITSANAQSNFNYVGNGDYKKQSCLTTQLAAMYSCKLKFDGYNLYCPTDCIAINLENQSQFRTSMTQIVVATLDYKEQNSGLYYQRLFIHSLYPISRGTYKLSFSAMTRKTGTPQSFAFTVSLLSSNFATTYFTKAYTFSTLGTINITEMIEIPTIYDSGLLYLSFNGGSSSSSTPIGAGITNVRFQKATCHFDETLALLTNGETACILKKTIQSFNYCSKFIYEHHKPAETAWQNPIKKGFSCATCYFPYKLVGMLDQDYDTSFKVYPHHTYGCTINEIPNVSWYIKLPVQDADGNYYYSALSCNETGNNFLVVPGISSLTYDASHQYCDATSDSTVSWWEVVNKLYLPAKCSSENYYPVIVDSTTRICQQISSPIPDCAIYNSDLTCYSCLGTTSLITWKDAGTIKNLCLVSSQVLHCNNFTFVSQAYVCSSCDSGYTLSTQKYCIRNDMFDGNCTIYALNTKNLYECSECETGYTLSYVELEYGPAKKCLATTSQIIRDCSAYQYIAGGIQCYKCSNTSANIDRYSFSYNSLTGYRCLNTLTEYVSNCITYDYISSVYKCTQCISNGQTHNLSIYCVQYGNNCMCKKCDTTKPFVSTSGFSCCSQITNCVQYDDFCKCTTCDNTKAFLSGNSLLCYSLISSCVSYDSLGKCTKCDQGFRISNIGNICHKQIANCLTYNDNNTCDLCSSKLRPSNSKSVCQSIIDKCQSYTDLGKCKTCNIKNDSNGQPLEYKIMQETCQYYNSTASVEGQVSYGTYHVKCMQGCLQCKDSYSCEKCSSSGYYLSTVNQSMSICLKCVSPCATCSADGSCLSCYDGSSLNQTSKQCKMCTSSLCLKCSANNLSNCSKCSNFYFLSNGICNACSDGCKTCNSLLACTECDLGYLLVSTSNLTQCSRCSEGCSKCTTTSCSECYHGYFKSSGTCTKCKKNCWTCISSSDCSECMRGFKLVQNECLENIQNCRIYNASTKICKQCYFGYKVNSTNALCIVNESQGNLYQTIYPCNKQHYLETGTSCNVCPSSYQNCEKCNEKVCLKCSKGFYLTTSLLCTSCQQTGCKDCFSGILCKQCSAGYYLSSISQISSTEVAGTCLACNSNCLTCYNSSTYCTSCNSSYILSSSAVCIPNNILTLTVKFDYQYEKVHQILNTIILEIINQLPGASNFTDEQKKIKKKLLQITKISNGSVTVDGYLGLSSSQQLTQTKSNLAQALASGKTFAGMEVISSLITDKNQITIQSQSTAFPMYVIIIIACGGGVLLIGTVILIICLRKRCCNNLEDQQKTDSSTATNKVENDQKISKSQDNLKEPSQNYHVQNLSQGSAKKFDNQKQQKWVSHDAI